MMPDIKKILFATRLSENSRHSLRYAFTIAKKFDAHITILHVIEPLSDEAKFAFAAYFEKEVELEVLVKREARVVDQMKEQVQDFCKSELIDDALCKSTFSIKVAKGYPEEQILKAIIDLQAEFLIMGAHEKGFTHTFLGDIAKRVLRRSQIPSLIIPMQEH